MKKIICLALCIVMLCFMLVSCDEDVITGAKEELDELGYKETVVEELELDFYIIVGEKTTENAMVTVEFLINQYLLDKFKTTLDIHYLTEAEYADTVKADMAMDAKDRADIVLVNSEELFDTLYNDHLIANITKQFDSTAYGQLNKKICDSLIDASLMYETVKGVNSLQPMNYCVPNNHIVGEYNYILINKEVAETLNCGENVTSKIISRDAEATLQFIARVEDPEFGGKFGYTVDESIKFVSGTYADKALYESQGYICNPDGTADNPGGYPFVNRAEVFSSAFVIARHEKDNRYNEGNVDDEVPSAIKNEYNNYYNRCMDIIYALNTDEYFRNLLQYGSAGTCYSLDEDGNVVSFTEGTGVYEMNILYTGNLFIAYYCPAIGWTKEVAEYGQSQNDESIVLFDKEETEDVPDETPDEEFEGELDT